MIKCHICTEKVRSLEVAIESHWHPTIWLNTETEIGPVCPRCAELLTRAAEDGEIELIPGCDMLRLLDDR